MTSIAAGYVSADGHVVEPADLWTTRIDKQFRDKAPRIDSRPNGDYYLIDGFEPIPVGLEGVAIDDKGVVFALETENLLDVAEMVLKACLLRKESRGPHLFFRRFEDPHPLPSQDRKGKRYIVIRNRSGKMVLERRVPVKLKIQLMR